jgi:predicted amidohydrolase
MMICFDWVFPETARCLALEGAQIIAHPSNLVLEWCQRAMFARSVENRVFTVTANRIGTEDRAGRKLTFTGASQIVSPSGEYLVRAPGTEEHVAVAELDPAEADDKHVTELNDLWQDRRPELYRRLT